MKNKATSVKAGGNFPPAMRPTLTLQFQKKHAQVWGILGFCSNRVNWDDLSEKKDTAALDNSPET